jgi:hypothetical protein
MTDRMQAVAQLVDACGTEADEESLLQSLAAATGLAVPRLWGLLGLAEDLRFVLRDGGHVETTAAGRKFASYMAAQRPPPGAAEDTVCMSMPPCWRGAAQALMGDDVADTESGEQRVAAGTRERLYIVTPFLSPDVLQYKLRDVLKPGAEVVIFTSDPTIGREDWSTNHVRRRLMEILGRRFGRVRLHHYDTAGMIIHAKLWLSEAGYFLTSANVKGDSANDNFEVGLHGMNPAVAGRLRRFLEGLPAMEGVRCLA